MSLPLTIVRNSDGSWAYSWTPTTATSYRVVLNGDRLAIVTDPAFVFKGGNYTIYPPPVEVTEDEEEAESEEFPPQFTLQWYAVDGASGYVVQRKVDLSWKDVAVVYASGGWVYTYYTPVLPDDTTADFRVMTLDPLGNLSSPRQYEGLMVCNPADPRAKFSYAGGTLTVSE